MSLTPDQTMRDREYAEHHRHQQKRLTCEAGHEYPPNIHWSEAREAAEPVVLVVTVADSAATVAAAGACT